MNQSINLRPIISEKSLARVESGNVYTFQAPPGATKTQIRHALERIFGVKAMAIHTKADRTKSKRAGKLRRLVKKADTKQVVIKLDKKDKIDLFEIKEGEKKK